ncbi:MAG TPA: twin-arginine translocase TatA/TatE family subunit [Gaiellaceae bacterium]|nr:twin-arginine translocase TatA/TatE family subunit [Gaiellaceae bacterium]
MPGNIGWQGALLIILVLLLVFGPKRLPEMGRSLGRGMREFKDSITGISGDEQLDEPEKVELTPPAQTTPADPAKPESERVSP